MGRRLFSSICKTSRRVSASRQMAGGETCDSTGSQGVGFDLRAPVTGRIAVFSWTSTSRAELLLVHSGAQYLATGYTRDSVDVYRAGADAAQLVLASFWTRFSLVFVLAATFFRWSWKVSIWSSFTPRKVGVGPTRYVVRTAL